MVEVLEAEGWAGWRATWEARQARGCVERVNIVYFEFEVSVYIFLSVSLFV